MPELDFNRFTFSVLSPLEVAHTMLRLLSADPKGLPSEAVILHLSQAVITQSAELDALKATVVALLAFLPRSVEVDCLVKKWLPTWDGEPRANP